MNNAYRRECRTALIAFLVMTLMTHIFPLYFLFPGLTQMTLFGFPAHYLITIIVGWLVLIPVYWVYIQISERVDREIEESDTEALAKDGEGLSPAWAAKSEGGAE